MSDHPPQPAIAARITKRLGSALHRARFFASLRHLHGPKQRIAAADEVVLVALVRDGAYYLDGFFDHYRRLGVAHFVFFDNGSREGTLDRLRQQPGVSILQSTLPWGDYENDFRSYAAKRYATDRWCLIADMDEIFDFEGRAEIGLRGLTGFLTDQGYTGLMAQMLEMFPKAPLSTVAALPYLQVLQQFDHCDISSVTAYDYQSPATGLGYFLHQNKITPPAPQLLFGGIRGKVFGESCCLTKHPLIYVGAGVTPAVHPHASTGLRLAPMSALIKHYKFANDALARDRASVAAASIAHGEDRQRLAVLQHSPDISLWSPQAQRAPALATLQQQGFLQADPAYSAYLASHTMRPLKNSETSQ
ncbi:glycosyltransferase family 2 protein [Pseudophaeobacter arcticus]|uniref:glycosyltransferase family 2 protein n=1 Tax=Pseudophaeobacter arcticus TaxID=385492 RepID=UPI0003F4B94F|nr:glycosyltransferase family 2 protein [Pseudophaeobacter arcticus]